MFIARRSSPDEPRRTVKNSGCVATPYLGLISTQQIEQLKVSF